MVQAGASEIQGAQGIAGLASKDGDLIKISRNLLQAAHYTRKRGRLLKVVVRDQQASQPIEHCKQRRSFLGGLNLYIDNARPGARRVLENRDLRLDRSSKLSAVRLAPTRRQKHHIGIAPRDSTKDSNARLRLVEHVETHFEKVLAVVAGRYRETFEFRHVGDPQRHANPGERRQRNHGFFRGCKSAYHTGISARPGPTRGARTTGKEARM